MVTGLVVGQPRSQLLLQTRNLGIELADTRSIRILALAQALELLVAYTVLCILRQHGRKVLSGRADATDRISRARCKTSPGMKIVYGVLVGCSRQN